MTHCSVTFAQVRVQVSGSPGHDAMGEPSPPFRGLRHYSGDGIQIQARDFPTWRHCSAALSEGPCRSSDTLTAVMTRGLSTVCAAGASEFGSDRLSSLTSLGWRRDSRHGRLPRSSQGCPCTVYCTHRVFSSVPLALAMSCSTQSDQSGAAATRTKSLNWLTVMSEACYPSPPAVLSGSLTFRALA